MLAPTRASGTPKPVERLDQEPAASQRAQRSPLARPGQGWSNTVSRLVATPHSVICSPVTTACTSPAGTRRRLDASDPTQSTLLDPITSRVEGWSVVMFAEIQTMTEPVPAGGEG